MVVFFDPDFRPRNPIQRPLLVNAKPYTDYRVSIVSVYSISITQPQPDDIRRLPIAPPRNVDQNLGGTPVRSDPAFVNFTTSAGPRTPDAPLSVSLTDISSDPLYSQAAGPGVAVIRITVRNQFTSTTPYRATGFNVYRVRGDVVELINQRNYRSGFGTITATYDSIEVIRYQGETFSYFVRNFNTAGEGDQSDTVSITTNIRPTGRSPSQGAAGEQQQTGEAGIPTIESFSVDSVRTDNTAILITASSTSGSPTPAHWEYRVVPAPTTLQYSFRSTQVRYGYTRVDFLSSNSVALEDCSTDVTFID